MRLFGWVAVLCIAIGGGWYYFHHGSDGDKAKGAGGKNGAPVPVGIATARIGDIDVYLSGLGNVTPRSTVTVHSLVNGELMRLAFQEGQMVKAGDLLAELDARPYEAQLEQAQGQLIRDQALLAEARIDLKRYQTLFAQDSIAKQQLDLQASLVKQYEGAVKNDQGLIDSAKVQIIYTKIASPVNGRVGLRQVDLGNIVHTTDTGGIVVVTELQPITVIFTLPEDTIPTVMQHMTGDKKLLGEAWDRDNKTRIAKGLLTAMDNEVDTTTGTVKFRAEFANKDNALFPSQFVNVRLRLDTKKNVVLMPTAAVQRGTQGTFVYLVKDGKTVAVTPVTLGTVEGETVEVASGLKAGDEVVTDGGDSLRDGAKIELPSQEPPKTASTPDTSAHKHKKHSSDDGQ